MSHATPQSDKQPMTSKLLRGAIWIAIGSLIAAALVCVVWVLVGNQDGIIGRAFLTILLLALFAGIAIAEAHLAEKRPDWLALTSMVTWIIALLVGAVKIWLPQGDEYLGWVMERFFQLAFVIGILQLALLHVRLFVRAAQRHVTLFTRVIVIVTLAMLAALVAMLVFYLTFPNLFTYPEMYWRIVIALTILVAVGTTLIPLLNALFAPKRPSSGPTTPGAPLQAVSSWPTYADGRTPLPVMPDGTPDWNAYYTGRPTYQQQAATNFPALQPAAAPEQEQFNPWATTGQSQGTSDSTANGPSGHVADNQTSSATTPPQPAPPRTNADSTPAAEESTDPNVPPRPPLPEPRAEFPPPPPAPGTGR